MSRAQYIVFLLVGFLLQSRDVNRGLQLVTHVSGDGSDAPKHLGHVGRFVQVDSLEEFDNWDP